MLRKNSVERYKRQILAFIEKNLYLDLRIKTQFFARFIDPLINLVLYIVLFGAIFSIKAGYKLGYWNSSNYILFILIAFSVQFSKPIINRYKKIFIKEKYWKTLSAIMVAPVNRFTLLVGGLISELIMVSIPLSVILIIAFILFPIPLINIILFFLVLLAIFLIFGSLGLIIGVFSISHEEYVIYFNFILRFIFLLSCTSYPKEIFPEAFQFFILLNPFYYLFDLLRLTWFLGINYEESIVLITPLHIIISILLTGLTPTISLYLFNRVYKKYGITGY